MTKENNVLISIRNEGRQRLRAFAESPTGFDNWTNLRFNEDFPDPVCEGSTASFDGTIYHINCESKLDRKNLTVKASHDNFKSYGSIFIDSEGGYSDIAVDKNELFILYERNVVNDGLYFKKIKLD